MKVGDIETRLRLALIVANSGDINVIQYTLGRIQGEKRKHPNERACLLLTHKRHVEVIRRYEAGLKIESKPGLGNRTYDYIVIDWR